MINCLECENLRKDTPWGEYTEPPKGYCKIRHIYIWNELKNCKAFSQFKEGS